MRVSSSTLLEVQRDTQRPKHSQGGRLRAHSTSLRSNPNHHELQNFTQKSIASVRENKSPYRHQLSDQQSDQQQYKKWDQQNFHRFKDLNQLPTRQRHAVETYLTNQRAAESGKGGEGELLRNIDYYA